MMVPKRYRLSLSVQNGGMVPRVDALRDGAVTFLTVLPLAAPCYAVRLGFANVFNMEQVIASACVYPSDSYGSAVEAMSVPNTKVRPAWSDGCVVGSPIYFDGLGDTAINLEGSKRDLVLPANPANVHNRAAPYVIRWSDWSPCTSVPRADDGRWPLLFVYVTIASTGFASSNADYPALLETNNRGKAYVVLRASTDGQDFADRPGDARWRPFGDVPFGPWFVLQYLTTTPGVQILQSGDSLSCGPTSDRMSTPIWRAAADLWTEALPIEVVNLACGGQTHQVYNSILRDNMDAVWPSLLVQQVISRNGMVGTAKMHQLLALALQNSHLAESRFGAKTIWNIPGGEPSWDGDSASTHGFIDMRSRLLALRALTGAQVIDGPSVLAPKDAPWNYKDEPRYSDDGIHPNDRAAEALTPMVRAAIKEACGIP